MEERSVTFERVFEMGREHDMRMKSLVLRSALIKNKIFVKSPPRDGTGSGQGGNGEVSMGGAGTAMQSPGKGFSLTPAPEMK